MVLDWRTRTSFSTIKNYSSKTTIPNTKHPFFITVDASLLGLRAVIFQLIGDNKMKVISYKCRFLKPQKQKFYTLDRELLGKVHIPQI